MMGILGLLFAAAGFFAAMFDESSSGTQNVNVEERAEEIKQDFSKYKEEYRKWQELQRQDPTQIPEDVEVYEDFKVKEEVYEQEDFVVFEMADEESYRSVGAWTEEIEDLHKGVVAAYESAMQAKEVWEAKKEATLQQASTLDEAKQLLENAPERDAYMQSKFIYYRSYEEFRKELDVRAVYIKNHQELYSKISGLVRLLVEYDSLKDQFKYDPADFLRQVHQDLTTMYSDEFIAKYSYVNPEEVGFTNPEKYNLRGTTSLGGILRAAFALITAAFELPAWVTAAANIAFAII